MSQHSRALVPTSFSLFSYGFIATALAFAGLPLYIYAPDLYATQFGISLVSLGSALLILRLLDAVLDPMIGILSDVYRTYRIWVLLCGSALFGLSFYLLFNPHQPSIFSFSMLVFSTTLGYSILSINLNTLGGLWGNASTCITNVVSVREVLGVVGLISATILPTVFQFSMPKAQSFMYLSVIMLVLLAVGSALLVWWYQHHSEIDKGSHIEHSISRMRYTAVLWSERIFFTTYFISMLASSIPAVVVLFFIRDLLQLEEYTGIFLLAYFASGMLGILIWKRVCRSLGYYRTWLISMSVAVMSFVWAALLSAGDMTQYLVICLISGVAFGAQLFLPPAILAERLEYYQEDNATLYFGILAFCTKLALAFASSVSLWYLGSIGFVPEGDNNPQALWGLIIVYTIIPSIISIGTMIIIWKKLL